MNFYLHVYQNVTEAYVWVGGNKRTSLPVWQWKVHYQENERNKSKLKSQTSLSIISPCKFLWLRYSWNFFLFSPPLLPLARSIFYFLYSFLFFPSFIPSSSNTSFSPFHTSLSFCCCLLMSLEGWRHQMWLRFHEVNKPANFESKLKCGNVWSSEIKWSIHIIVKY